MRYLILIYSLTFFNGLFSQCDNSVVTNPDGPVNTSLPSNSPFLNEFDWNAPNLAPIQLTNMQYNQLMLHLMSPQQPQYYNYIYDGEQQTSENGWELLLLNTGVYPDLSNLSNGGHSDIPYIVLYNRYTAIIRVFANYGNGYLPSGISFDAVKVILEYDNPNKVNGLLRLENGHDQALDKKTDVSRVVGLAKHANSPGKWFVADLQIAYDPCVCYYPSNMRLAFEFIESESLELHGRGIQVEHDIINGTALETKDYLSAFDYTGNTAEGGILMYRTLENMVDDYELKLEDYKTKLQLVNEFNEKVERNLMIIKLFKHVIINGGNSTITALANKPWLNNAITYANDLLGDTIVTKKSIIDAAKSSFGTGLDMLITQHFQKKPVPTSPVTPKATFSEMHYKGQLINSTRIDGPNFYTPGTYGTLATGTPSLVNNELAYPIYNDMLGTFALLKAPKLTLSWTSEMRQNDVSADWIQDFNTPNGSGGRWRLYGQRYQRWDKNYQFKLAEDLIYTFNSTLDIKSTSVKAAIVVKAIPKKTIPASGGINNAKLNKNFTTNLVSTNRNIEDSPYIKNHVTYLGESVTLPKYFVDYSQGFTTNFDSVMYQSEFFPIDAFRNNVYAIGLNNEYLSDVVVTSPEIGVHDNCDEYPFQNSLGEWCYPTPSQVGHVDPPQISIVSGGYTYNFEFSLKLMVDIEFETPRSDGTPNIVTQIYTYEIEPEDINNIAGTYIASNLEGSSIDIMQYPENLSLATTSFNGSYIKGCKLSGNTYSCKAWNNISINGDLTTAGGYNVEIVAGNEIYELPESSVSPEIVRYISPVLDYSHPMPEVAPEYVIDFCDDVDGNSPAYQANIEGKSLIPSGVNGVISGTTEKPLEMLLYPNPSHGIALIKLNKQCANLNVMISDFTGKELLLESFSFVDAVNLDMSDYAPGAYLITVSTPEGTLTKQLIKQ